VTELLTQWPGDCGSNIAAANCLLSNAYRSCFHRFKAAVAWIWPLMNICYDVILYGSHRIVFITKQTTLIQSDFTQVYYSLKLLSLHVGYMFQPVLISSLGISIQKLLVRVLSSCMSIQELTYIVLTCMRM